MQNAPTLQWTRLLNSIQPRLEKFYYVPDDTWLPNEENFVTIAEVIEGIAVTRARPMAAAMRPYSIAVAPDSSLKNFFMINSSLF
jgi:hypothetical protein